MANGLDPRILEYLKRKDERGLKKSSTDEMYGNAQTFLDRTSGWTDLSSARPQYKEYQSPQPAMDPLVETYIKNKLDPNAGAKMPWQLFTSYDAAGNPQFKRFHRGKGYGSDIPFQTEEEAKKFVEASNKPETSGGLGSPKKEKTAEERAEEARIVGQAKESVIKKPTKAMADELADAAAAVKNLQALVNSYNTNSMGTISQRLKAGTDPQLLKTLGLDTAASNFVADSKQSAQAIGLFLEQGKLQANDYPRYREEILPSERDTAETAQSKALGLKRQALELVKNKIAAYEQSGFDVTGLKKLLKDVENLDVTIDTGGGGGGGGGSLRERVRRERERRQGQ